MIEFKAECGHTVRAKDEDAGGAVRCSYCGRPANVPENKSDTLDFLFNDLKPQGEALPPPRRPRSGGWFKRRPRKPGEFNPFSIVLRLCYAALLIIVVIVVGRMWIIPLFQEGGLARRVTSGMAQPPQPAPLPRGGPRDRVPESRPGLMNRDYLVGLYVNSTPPGASLYCVEASRAPAKGRIHEVPGCQQPQSAAGFPHLPDGEYVVEVVFPWNDPSLTGFRGYLDFRRKIAGADDATRRRLMQEYFVPDDAADEFVHETAEQIYLVRQYRQVEVRNKRSLGVRALFLPRLAAGTDGSFSIEELVTSYIPREPAYAFDEQHVRSELRFYGVRDADETFVVQALQRIGVVPYVTPDQRTRLFKIGLEDGAFAARVIRETEP